MPEPTVIIGAGLAGLACAHELGTNCIILEREPRAGGTARTFERDGFHFDRTGHWLHLRDDSVRSLVEQHLGDRLVTLERRAEVHSQGVRTPYPFQANTYGLPPQVVADCLLGYFAAREAVAAGQAEPPRTFEDFIRLRMGDGIARHFMIPYNAKLFTVPPSQMDYAWCERYVPIPTPLEVVLGAITPGGANHALGYNATFRYPKGGGIGQLAERLAASLDADLRLGTSVRSIDWKKRTVQLGDGTDLAYGALVSTAPLPDLVAMLADPPEAVTATASKLRAASVTYWDVGVAGANRPTDAHWIYFPGHEVPFYRAGSASAAAPWVAPENHRSYYVEVSHRRGTPCNVSDAQILAGMRRVGLLGKQDEPVVMHRSTIDCAYVIMDTQYGAARGGLLEWLAKERVLSIGRYGGWIYASMEGAIREGRAAAASLRDLS
jgi:protoporphyrinogen oxidase